MQTFFLRNDNVQRPRRRRQYCTASSSTFVLVLLLSTVSSVHPEDEHFGPEVRGPRPPAAPAVDNGVCTVTSAMDGYAGSGGKAPVQGTLRSCIWMLNVGT